MPGAGIRTASLRLIALCCRISKEGSAASLSNLVGLLSRTDSKRSFDFSPMQSGFSPAGVSTSITLLAESRRNRRLTTPQNTCREPLRMVLAQHEVPRERGRGKAVCPSWPDSLWFWYDLCALFLANGDKVRDAASPKPEPKKSWELTADAFHQLLEWLDEGTDSGGEKYLEMRRRLVSFFDRKNCLAPDDLADETLNRVARRLKEEGAITNTTPAHYLYIVARFVFLEYLRRTETGAVSLDSASQLVLRVSVWRQIPTCRFHRKKKRSSWTALNVVWTVWSRKTAS